MGINKYKPHLLVLPEDDANRQIANGFLRHPDLNGTTIQILPPSGGWGKVVEAFRNDHIRELRRWSERRLLLVIDFDDQPTERLSQIKEDVPEDLKDRVFILGTLSEPENLRKNLRISFEDIGEGLSKDCADNTQDVWEHELLQHNKAELDRMINVRRFLFD